MFKLFTKQKPVHKEYTVKEIHDEFDNAEDKLLLQADNLLSELNVTTETDIEKKAAALKSIGFVNTPTVKQAENITIRRKETQEVIVKTKEQADLIRYYKQTYPFQKFLTEAELDRICTKYNLIYAPIQNYTEDVPDKNVKEIQSTSYLRSEDYIKDKYFVEIIDFWRECPLEIKAIFKNPVDYSEYANQSTNEPSEGSLLKLAKKLGYNGDYSHYVFRTATVKRVSKEGLFICAPSSHFDLKELSKEGKLGYFNIQEWEIKDPIVFRYCRGGVQVITKWGLEANDKDLVNEQMN